MPNYPDRSETFTAKERNAIRVLLEALAKHEHTEDAVELLVLTPGVLAALGVQSKTADGLYRMVRNDPKIHEFLQKIYDPTEHPAEPAAAETQC